MKCILFSVEKSFDKIIFEELFGYENVLLYKDINNCVLNQLRRVHTSLKANTYFDLPFQGIWKHTYFDEEKLNNDEECIFLFEEGNKQAYNYQYIKYLKEKYKRAFFVFIFWNPTYRLIQKNIKFVQQNYDMVVSFDNEDCVKYNWAHYSGIYSVQQKKKESVDIVNDIFFVGNNKGRLSMLHCLYDAFCRAGLKCDFYITNVPKDQCIYEGIHYNEFLVYDEVIQHINNSHAILELLQPCQHGSTLRPMEALVYEKLLITNNQEIRKERYFKEKQFCILDDSDVDVNHVIEMLRKGERFTYEGEVSPHRFLDFLAGYYNK